MRRIQNNFRNHSNWMSYYKHKYLNKGTDFTFKCRSGLMIKVPARLMHTYKECFFDETYLKGFPGTSMASPIKTIIDIGANVGYFSLSMLSLYPESSVFAYEPIPVNFNQLSKYKSENPNLNFNVTNAAVTKLGIESISLNYDDSDTFTTSASIFDDNKQKNQLIVKATSLDKILDDNQLETIDLLKLDCEGSEYDILYNCTDEIIDRISMMAIETHQGTGENENTQSMADFIKKHNFQVKVDGDIIWAWK